MLRVLVNAPWHVPNWLLHRDLNIPSVRDVITKVHAAVVALKLIQTTWPAYS
jgi:hypothetical protein